MTTISEDRDDASGNDSDHEEGLTSAICQRLVEDFVERTQTNEALAQSFLQDVKWNLTAAINKFLDETGGIEVQKKILTGSTSVKSQNSVVGHSGDSQASSGARSGSVAKVTRDSSVSVPEVTIDTSDEEEPATGSSSKKLKSHRKELIFITYNIDGLCDKNRVVRTEAVCKIIQDTKADIVFLQEVVPSTEKTIREMLSFDYEIISGSGYKGFPSEYFTLSLFRKATVVVNSSKKIDYEVSVMTRNMLTANVTVNGVTVNTVNTHFESTKDHRSHRIKQFDECYEFAKKCPLSEPVIIAGDLNMREKEVADAGGLPPDMIDAWIATGRKKECEYTWDMMRNDNLDGNFGKFKPRCRFDRILVRDSKPSRLIPSLFNLIGLERLKPHVCFPSDHWGILCVFNTFH